MHQDYTKAFKFFLLSADQGHRVAQYYLGESYNNGSGVARNFYQAAKWFKLSAEQGYSSALHVLATYYLHGRGGLPQDDREAARLFKLSEEAKQKE